MLGFSAADRFAAGVDGFYDLAVFIVDKYRGIRLIMVVELIFKRRIGLFDLLQRGNDLRVHRFRCFVGHISSVNADFGSPRIIVHRDARVYFGHRHVGLTIFCHRLFGDDLISQFIQGGHRFHGLFDCVLAAVFVVFITRFDRFGRVAAVAVYNHLARIYAAVADHQIGRMMILAAGLHADSKIRLDQVILQKGEDAVFAAALLIGYIVQHDAALGVKTHLFEEFHRHQGCAVSAFHVAGASAVNKAVFDFAGPSVITGVLRFRGWEHIHVSVEQKGFSLLTALPLCNKVGSVFLIFIGIDLNIQLIQPFFHGQRHRQFAPCRAGRLNRLYQTLQSLFFAVGHFLFDFFDCNHRFSSFIIGNLLLSVRASDCILSY